MSDQIQPWPVVKRGSQGHPVPALQYLLRDRGHHVTVDGIFGPKTEAAVEQFQIADQLHVDGIVGPQTWGALVIVLARGSTGDAVRGLQEEFRFREQSGGPGHGLAVDGIFGPKTLLLYCEKAHQLGFLGFLLVRCRIFYLVGGIGWGSISLTSGT